MRVPPELEDDPVEDYDLFEGGVGGGAAVAGDVADRPVVDAAC